MANNTAPSIESLPVEIFHRIFDHLDAQTILSSVQLVCRFFRSVVNSYDRYKFDFKLISKSNFHHLCRLIPPQHVISLTLYKNEQIPDQISFFTLNYRLRQLTRLRSINLFGIDECQLNFVLKRINPIRLTSFSLNVREYDERRKKTTGHQLSSILAQPTLRKVELNVKSFRLSNIEWPTNCPIESLIINENITTNILFRILSYSPQLHTLIIKEKSINVAHNVDIKCGFPQITSLILEKVDTSHDFLKLFLSLTPSLVYLKLIGQGAFDGKQWEEFIQGNLPQLKKFEFLIRSLTSSTDQTQDDLRLIIQTFQSPFWVEHKKWFVACEFDVDLPRAIHIYSIPICKTVFNEKLDSKICFLSTSDHLVDIEKINEIDLQLKHAINNDLIKTINTPFPNVTKLRLEFRENISTDLIRHLRSIFNPSRLVEVHLESSCFDVDNKDHLFNVIKLLDQSSKFTSLTIHSRILKFALYPYLNDLCSMLPRQIKYLQMPISQLEQVENILEQCPYLSIGKFEMKRRKVSLEVAEWFEQNTIDSIFRREFGFCHVWIGGRINPINENPKRVKLKKNESN